MPKQDKHHKCPCCGYAVEKRIGKPNGTQFFGPVQQAVFNVVRDCPDGIGGEALYERVWGTREVRSENIVAVTIKCVNNKIKKWGLKIRGHGGPGSVYHLLKIEAQSNERGNGKSAGCVSGPDKEMQAGTSIGRE